MNNSSAIGHALDDDRIATVKLLIKHGAEVNIHDDYFGNKWQNRASFFEGASVESTSGSWGSGRSPGEEWEGLLD